MGGDVIGRQESQCASVKKSTSLPSALSAAFPFLQLWLAQFASASPCILSDFYQSLITVRLTPRLIEIQISMESLPLHNCTCHFKILFFPSRRYVFWEPRAIFARPIIQVNNLRTFCSFRIFSLFAPSIFIFSPLQRED